MFSKGSRGPCRVFPLEPVTIGHESERQCICVIEQFHRLSDSLQSRFAGLRLQFWIDVGIAVRIERLRLRHPHLIEAFLSSERSARFHELHRPESQLFRWVGSTDSLQLFYVERSVDNV